MIFLVLNYTFSHLAHYKLCILTSKNVKVMARECDGRKHQRPILPHKFDYSVDTRVCFKPDKTIFNRGFLDLRKGIMEVSHNKVSEVEEDELNSILHDFHAF